MVENVFNLSKDVMKGYFLEVSTFPERDEKTQFCKRGCILSLDKMKALLNALN
jgi:hypothetical protein